MDMSKVTDITINGKAVNKISDDLGRTLWEKKQPEPTSTLNYMVNIYGIGQDLVDEGANLAGLTFGPAVGETADCLHINGSAEHGKATGGHCICEDTWDEIIKNCNEGHADYYSACLDYHCAKSVPLILNSTIGTQPTENQYVSILYDSIAKGWVNYTDWNKTASTSKTDPEQTNWATSRIRATLNGKTGHESSWAGTDCLDNTNCLLSCFPQCLQIALKSKYYKVPTNWSTQTPYTISDFIDVNDKLWLMNAEEIWGATVETNWKYVWEWGKAQYKRNLDAGITTSAYSNNIGYKESSSAGQHWLRCPHRITFYWAGCVISNGNILHDTVNVNQYGLSPCFCLGTNGPATKKDKIRLGIKE